MHGRPREYKHKLRDPAAAAAHAKKVAAIKQGTALVLECRQQRRYDQVALVASEKLLRIVPEVYTLWNYRREALAPLLSAGGDAAASAAAAELALTAACLQENPKSYSTWHHRRWLVAQGVADLSRELELVTSALALDNRNFHAWGYRRFVVRALGRPPEAELSYTDDLIAANFSNYSAWHYRTLLLPQLHCEDIRTVSLQDLLAGATPSPPLTCAREPDKQQQQHGGFAGSATQTAPLPPHVLDQEYELVHQAFAADCGDQSSWIYYRWLLGNSLAHVDQATARVDRLQTQAARGECAAAGTGAADAAASLPAAVAALEEARLVLGEVLSREVGRFAEHLELDSEAKWPLLMTARLKEAQARLGLHSSDGASEGHDALRKQAAALYRKLAVVDPMRAGYYNDAAEGRAYVVVQALGTV